MKNITITKSAGATKNYEINEDNPYIKAAVRIRELGKENKVDTFVACKMWELESGIRDEDQRVEFLHLINDAISAGDPELMTLDRLVELM
ncbi:hypothetical protein [Bacilliculturomica massiliensis]|uniref:hypothetical protein n=1 Tax=Bacilliculturomica massiliensis TaxID=1917867 RepID=UPI0010318B64|nr:hypothetical protein [Bacilliculturomica massiliensis]